MVGGTSIMATPSYTSNEHESLKLLLQGLQITNKVKLISTEEEEGQEDSDEEDSFYKDWERLTAHSESLAKYRVSKPPIETPRNRYIGDSKYS
jgi:hypothetical protein